MLNLKISYNPDLIIYKFIFLFALLFTNVFSFILMNAFFDFIL